MKWWRYGKCVEGDGCELFHDWKERCRQLHEAAAQRGRFWHDILVALSEDCHGLPSPANTPVRRLKGTIWKAAAAAAAAAAPVWVPNIGPGNKTLSIRPLG